MIYYAIVFQNHITDHRDLHKACRVFFSLLYKMEKHKKDSIYERVQLDFGVNVLRRYYYCSGLSLETFKRKLKIRHR